jgi:hypothetical protein
LLACRDDQRVAIRGTVTKLLYSATMSLDGLIAGPGGDMQWLAKHLAEPNPEAAALMEC